MVVRAQPPSYSGLLVLLMICFIIGGGWAFQAEFLKKIVNAVDKHKITLGYEILNEPHIRSTDQWEKVGKYNSFMTD